MIRYYCSGFDVNQNRLKGSKNMFKDKKCNYLIGIFFGACLLGFLALPFLGEANGYD